MLAQLHAGPGRWRSHAVRPPHADGVRHPAGGGLRWSLNARQCLANPSGAGGGRAWLPDLRNGFAGGRRDRHFLRALQIDLPGVAELPIEGSRGSGSQAFAAHIWGLKQDRVSGVSPIPGRTIPRAKSPWASSWRTAVRRGDAEQLMAIKGLAFAEPGPSDNSWSHLRWDAVRGDLSQGTARGHAGFQAPGGRPGTHPPCGQGE